MLSGTSSDGLSDPTFMASDHPASLVCLSDLADSDNPTPLSFAEHSRVGLSEFTGSDKHVKEAGLSDVVKEGSD